MDDSIEDALNRTLDRWEKLYELEHAEGNYSRASSIKGMIAEIRLDMLYNNTSFSSGQAYAIYDFIKWCQEAPLDYPKTSLMVRCSEQLLKMKAQFNGDGLLVSLG